MQAADRRCKRSCLALVLVRVRLLLCILGALLACAPAASAADRPNVVVLMTDDQTVSDLDAMPRAQALLGAGGVTFDRFYVSYPLCCPSRATYLSGQYAHNHQVLGLHPPTGGYARFDALESLPVWLQRAGYHTAHLGKYLNGYGSETPADVPPGWSDWYGAVDDSTYRMWGYTLNENGTLQTYGGPFEEDPRNYQTDVLARKAVELIEQRAASTEPLFLSVAFLAPHHEGSNVRRTTGRIVRAAPREAGSLATKRFRRPRGFNEADISDKPFFLRRRPRMGPAQIARIVANYRARQESLLAVDDAVSDIVAALRSAGQLDNTYVMLTSDNGFMQGEHRVPTGKMLPYDPSTQVPLLIRGPGLPQDEVSQALVGNVDLAPTILEIAGASSTKPLDGRSLLALARDPSLEPKRSLLHETGGQRFVRRIDQDTTGAPPIRDLRSYRAIRTTRWLYVEYRGGMRELYDLDQDPHQLRSLHRVEAYFRLRARLARRLDRLARCAGPACLTY
jgi:N-acetylglucosamine-6-sulfatase